MLGRLTKVLTTVSFDNLRQSHNIYELQIDEVHKRVHV